MIVYATTSKRAVKAHLNLWKDPNAKIKSGTKFFRFSNGTIGTGARYINVTMQDLKEMYKECTK